MKKLICILVALLISFSVEARPIHHPAPHHHHHHGYVVHNYHHRSSFGNTFAGAIVGAMIGTYLIRDTYMTYNHRARVPQNCVTMVNQNNGTVMTQCSQNPEQVIYVGD